MARTYRKTGVIHHSPRHFEEKRPQQHLREEILEDLELMKRIRSPLYDWEMRRRERKEANEPS